MKHITVLQNEAVTGLNLKPDSIVIDATLGAGGHAKLILGQLSAAGSYIGLDADPTAIEELTGKLSGTANIKLFNKNFSELSAILDELGIVEVDAILADLGWRTDQFTDGNRGFSFTDESALTMTYGDPEKYPFVASDIVNGWAEEDIANVLYGYGEERYSRRIAKAIVQARSAEKITSAKSLADIIASAVPPAYRHGRTNPATKSFQALRIAVNDEFAVLESFLAQAWQALAKDGRLTVITFHSLEDRIVKHTFRSYTHDQTGVLVSKKPITPNFEELAQNPRSRSAKLRIIEKL
ncbi:16S rRNA (cytosine(1402)-N(4))-methyltransferase [Candidatus Kaiserbacteria bacterium RIFOXYD1_FULL_42_15]|uniref:Ribosomal RNA small subunit methyltransferase H n=1 Tax=Candidatus Kaiserbacteria bacterium RIFOXYD1_FULL_42_15 TaxID=1798532 RepID=A0A1F6FRD2_9BACT|nr:MAG: 16S rRNA (cytosine(1402)-N(4))-methyltransferase [Candidatus Kaiserbacteria bacterium RIFOXYD1_FULL_42_15]